MPPAATPKGGECLSEAYLSNHKPLRWRCSRGHEWFASASAIKNAESWRQKCAGQRKLSLEDVRALAIVRGLVWLSSVYVNRKRQLHWRCADNHEWAASLGQMTREQWACSLCELAKKAA